jgi:hypothetical protein
LTNEQLSASQQATLFTELCALLDSGECDSEDLSEFGHVPAGAVPEGLMTRARSAVRGALEVSAVVSGDMQCCSVRKLILIVLDDTCIAL